MGPFFSGYKTHAYDLRHFSPDRQLSTVQVATGKTPRDQQIKVLPTIDGDDFSWFHVSLALNEEIARGLRDKRDMPVVGGGMNVGVTGNALPHGSLDFSGRRTDCCGVELPMDATNGLRVAIVGAGVAGLVAALKLRRNGHAVTLFEKESLRKRKDTGIAALVGPNALRSLCQLGFDLQAAGVNKCEGVLCLNAATGAIDSIKAFDIADQKYEGQDREERPWHICHCIDLHNELKRLVLDPQGEGEPANLHLGITIQYVDVHTGTVRLGDGRAFHSDLIIGADGVNSACRKYVQHGAKLMSSGQGYYRFMVSRETLLRDPETSTLVEKSGYICEVVDADRRMVLSPCRKNTMVSVVVFVADEEAEKTGRAGARESYEVKSDMEDAFEGGSGAVRKVLQYAGEDMKYWTLNDVQFLKRRQKKKLVLVGDAAQPLFAYPGQGATQAIEDSLRLATLLHSGTKVNELEDRLKLYGDLRRRRIQGTAKQRTQIG